jgi:hypothetical protein
MIDDARGQQDGAGADGSPLNLGYEAFAVMDQTLDPTRPDDGAVFLGLFAHPLQNIGARDAGRKARHIVAERDPAGARRAGVHHHGPPTKPPEIGRRRQTGRARADDQDLRVVHRVRQATGHKSDGTPAHSPIVLSCVRTKRSPVQAQV